MIEVMEYLDTLADHENERISIISSKLHRLIVTQKVVIDEIKNLREATSKLEAENLKMKSKVQEMKQIKVDEEHKLMDERCFQRLGFLLMRGNSELMLNRMPYIMPIIKSMITIMITICKLPCALYSKIYLWSFNVNLLSERG